MGATTAIIGKTLAHKSVEATRVYERIDIDPVREFITLANEAIYKEAFPQDDLDDKLSAKSGGDS